MGYQQEQKKLDKLAELHEIATNATYEVKTWFARMPEIRDIEANYKIIFDYFHGDLQSISADPGESLDTAWREHPAFRASLACWPDEQEEKDALSDRILALLKNGTSPQNLVAEKAKHKFMSVVALRIKAAELQERSEMHKKSTAELRAIIQRPAPEYSLPPEISAQQIKHMWGPEQFRYWTQKFGGKMEPINRRLRGEN